MVSRRVVKSCLIEFCLTVRLSANDGEFRNLGASDFRSLRLGNELTIDLRMVTLIDSSLEGIVVVTRLW